MMIFSAYHQTAKYVCFISAWIIFLLIPTASHAQTLNKKLKVEGKIYYRFIRVVRNHYEGRIKTINVANDQPVKKGQLLGTYKLTAYDRNSLKKRVSSAGINQMTLDMEDLRNKVESSERDLDAQTTLLKEGMAAQLTIDSIKDQLDLLKERLDYAQKELQVEKENLQLEREHVSETLGGLDISNSIPKNAALISPIDGNVLWSVEKPKWNLKKNTACFKVANTEDVFAKVKIFVEDYPKLAEGMKAVVTLKSEPKKKFDATISKIPLTPINKNYAALSYYHVELDIPNAGQTFREGNSVTVTFPPQTVDNETAQ